MEDLFSGSWISASVPAKESWSIFVMIYFNCRCSAGWSYISDLSNVSRFCCMSDIVTVSVSRMLRDGVVYVYGCTHPKTKKVWVVFVIFWIFRLATRCWPWMIMPRAGNPIHCWRRPSWNKECTISTPSENIRILNKTDYMHNLLIKIHSIWIFKNYILFLLNVKKILLKS